MMQKISRVLKVSILAFLLVLLSNVTFAQNQNDLPDPPDPEDVPIDGGLSILLAAGVGYVAKKGYDKRKRDAQQLPVQEK